MDGPCLLCALASSSMPAWERPHAMAGVQESKGQHTRSLEAHVQEQPSFLLHSVSRSKSQSQIHGTKKWTLLSERRGRPDCTDTGWRKILVLFANKIPPQAQLLGRYPVTLQLGQGGWYPQHSTVKDMQEAK